MHAKASGESTIQPIPAGVYIAVCYGVIDLGTQTSDSPVYGVKTKHEALIQWEVPEVRIEMEKDGEKVNLPRAISNRYTLSLHEKAALRRDLEAWRNKPFSEDELGGFDMKNILGKVCQIQVANKPRRDGKGQYAYINAIMALPKGSPRPEPENPLCYFTFEEWEGESIEDYGMPEWVVGIIAQSPEYKEVVDPKDHRPDEPEDEPDEEADNLPF